MTLWRCPKCAWQTEQPPHVTDVTHRCNPNIPRAVRLVRQQEETT